ncbi:MAG: PorT family protein [Ignavibacteriales bacterium]|nr:PorT family protein [Ignavibacteriales bacterium]
MKNVFAQMFALLLVLSTSIFAQKFVVGVKGGLNLASMSIDPTPSVDIGTRTGVVAGAYVGIIFGDFSTQTEFTYSMKGMTYLGGGINYTWKLDFFEIPVLLKYNIPLKGNVTPNIFVGPTVSFALNTQVHEEVSGLSTDTDIDEWIES